MDGASCDSVSSRVGKKELLSLKHKISLMLIIRREKNTKASFFTLSKNRVCNKEPNPIKSRCIYFGYSFYFGVCRLEALLIKPFFFFLNELLVLLLI